MPFNPSYDFDSFAPTFEDPFSYSTRHFEPVQHQDANNDEASPQELDNKLLGFSEPVVSASIVDENGTFADLAMTAELYGMFFVAEDVFGGETTGRPLELTCYRRNLWQCSGQLTLPRSVYNVMDDQGRQIPIAELSASITALESIEGKATEIISIPWKSTNPQTGEENKVAGPPPNINLDLSSGQELDANRVSVGVSWKRLQFKHATANNGRRKGLQQHYVVQITLLGKVKTGETIKIAEIQSGPVIVRGRSPRNFDSRKDVPLSSDTKQRKNTMSSDAGSLKQEREILQGSIQRFPSVSAAVPVCNTLMMRYAPTKLTNTQNPAEWATPQPVAAPNQSPHPSKRVAMSPSTAKPPIPPWGGDGIQPVKIALPMAGQAPRGSVSRQSTGAPINLSLSEDERSPNRSSTELQSPQMGKSYPAVGQNLTSSPIDEVDPLYEYFPLTVDDW